MTSTTFIPNVTVIEADWLNDVNTVTYKTSANVKLFGALGDGVTDDTAAIQAAVNASPSVTFPAGTYIVSSQIDLPHNYTSLSGTGSTIIKANFPNTSTDAIFRMAGAGPTGSVVTSTSALTFGGTSLPVTDASSFQVNDVLQITSTEYFNGIAGVSGYGVKTKGEMSRVKSVSGNTITVLESFKDDYALSGQTISVTKLDTKIGLVIEGLAFYGTGGGASHTGANPTGARAVACSSVFDIRITNCSVNNFPRFGFTFSRCKDVIVSNCVFYGYDLNDPTNVPPASVQWFTGTTFNSCESVTFTTNIGRNCRRHFDADSTIATPISRNLAVLSNTAINTTTMVGTHACDRITIIGNVGISSGGIVMRGKNSVITGNSIGVSDSSTFAISCGYNGSLPYTEPTSVGRVVISGNNINGSFSAPAIRVNADIDSAVIADNNIGSFDEVGILIGGKNTNNIKITGNVLNLPTASGGAQVGIFIPNLTAIPRESLNNIIIANNMITLNGAGSGIVVAGALQTAPADNIIISDNAITGNGLRHIGLTTTGLGGANGWFGQNVKIADNVCVGVASVASVAITGQSAGFPNIQGTMQPNIFANEYTANNGATLNSGYTYLQGMRVVNSTPVASGYLGKVCVQSGTQGTLSGVTGAISAGSALLTVNAVANIDIGDFLAVAGAGLTSDARVIAISGLDVTLSENAASSVTGAAVTRTAPVFKDYGAIVA
jgi:hypothetical protein